MESKAAKKKNSFTHRFVQVLLGSSSCITTTTAAAVTTTTTPTNNNNKLRGNADRPLSVERSAPRVAPVVQVSADCGARHREKRSTELYEAIKKEQRRLPPTLLSSCAKNTSSSSYCYRGGGGGGGGGGETKKKTLYQNKAKDKRKETMRLLPGANTTSSCEPGVYYSSEDYEDDENEGTLFSSRSFSSDSSEFYRSKWKNNTSNYRKGGRASAKCTPRPQTTKGVLMPQKGSYLAEADTKMVTQRRTSEAAKTRGLEGFAVVKRSRDPYMDFRSSMVEMIVERRISSSKDLEGLLHSFLCLNSARHHPVIVEAFGDIWEAMFCCVD